MLHNKCLNNVNSLLLLVNAEHEEKSNAHLMDEDLLESIEAMEKLCRQHQYGSHEFEFFNLFCRKNFDFFINRNLFEYLYKTFRHSNSI